MKIGFVNVMHKSKLRPNGFKYISEFIESLYKHCNKDFMLYLYDNESDEQYNVTDYPNLKYTYIEDQSIGGLAYPINCGVKEAVKDGCDIIVLTNDDVVLNDTINVFFDIIDKHEYKDVSLYGPLTNGVLPMNYFQKADGPGKGVDEITKINTPCKELLNGFLYAFTKELYEKVKYLNGELANPSLKWGGGELDLHDRVKAIGGKVFVIKDCWVLHHKIRGWLKVDNHNE